MAVVGTTVEERAGLEEEVGESKGRSKESSPEAGGEEEGGDTWAAVWMEGREAIIAGEALAGGMVGGAEAAMAADWFCGGAKAWKCACGGKTGGFITVGGGGGEAHGGLRQTAVRPEVAEVEGRGSAGRSTLWL